MAMSEILQSVRRDIMKWTSTKTPLIGNAAIGDTVINVGISTRFRVGDEIILRNSLGKAETPIIVKSIIDSNNIELVSPLNFAWTTTDNTVVEKLFYHNYVKGYYFGEPSNMLFPCVTISITGRDSEPLTLKSTKETYNVKIMVYVEQSNQEDAYLFLCQLTDAIQLGLKRNIYPLVGPYNNTALLADAMAGDVIIRVADSSIFDVHRSRMFIHDVYKSEENVVHEIIDSTTIRIGYPLCYNYYVSDSGGALKPDRFIYYSWPKTISVGDIFKGTFMKAARIEWFAWEEELNGFGEDGPLEPILY